jgi:hypothetical protein
MLLRRTGAVFGFCASGRYPSATSITKTIDKLK